MATRTEAFAPAKVNLALHVTGRRADGYHLLDSLVAFADIGDRIFVDDGKGLTLSVTGPRAAGVPTGPENLVLRAATAAGVRDAAITLEKHLPAAGGIGGGSSDAAATLRACAERFGAGLPYVLALGADVPVCMTARAARMSGIGEVVEPLDGFPDVPAVLVNPGIEVPTGAVFAGLQRRDGQLMEDLVSWTDVPALVAWLDRQRNDLEAPALKVAPAIGDVLGALRQAGAALARMSGSGATCFGIFETREQADAASWTLASENPVWWVAPTVLR
ncbi:4-(cytidine 5'-diphospho)-2-C-methyl-D-erythritol kinase [Chachezhania antarctica]|uniref:4-(cytidine 5'-diphospho)-2-C-methyl-D-erythritol kinase n=1 Tax=Chachezhania antarctica TaxID=2340860 RepID=UPI000EB4DEC8|nr:4-(cytidine 5'-diphospho)-2-C-methyl-D-erythritol kinase [Chachezhania antarctica]|tara:strand:- start:3258 stop:4082 length:825 start_codon:yes stop_codon:yes gene_type:complete